MTTTRTTYKTILGNHYTVTNQADTNGNYKVDISVPRNLYYIGKPSDYFNVEDAGASYEADNTRVTGHFSVKVSSHEDAVNLAQAIVWGSAYALLTFGPSEV